MRLLQELTVLLRTDAVTDAAYVRALVTMDAQAEVTKLRLSVVTWQMTQELKRLDQASRSRPT